MKLIFATAVVSLLTILVAGRLQPTVSGRRARMALALIALLSIAAWGIPIAMGRGLHGHAPYFGAELKQLGSAWIVTSWLTLMGLIALLVAHLVRLPIAAVMKRREQQPEKINASRRTFLTQVGGAVPIAAAMGGVGGVVSGDLPFRLRRETVPILGLPKALDGFRIGQITDVHVGAFVSPADARRAVEALNSEHVDVQVQTGDLIDDLDAIDETFDVLARNTAPHGMFAIYGNHEHFRGLPAIRSKYKQLIGTGKPVRLLVDESAVITHNGTPIRIVGVDYPSGRGIERDQAMIGSAARAFAACQPGETVLCLAHHPAFFPIASQHGARLTISGHTHGGQIAFLGIPVFAFLAKYILGRYKDGDNHLFVSGGTGHWMPFRIGVPAEVTVITLKAV